MKHLCYSLFLLTDSFSLLINSCLLRSPPKLLPVPETLSQTVVWKEPKMSQVIRFVCIRQFNREALSSLLFTSSVNYYPFTICSQSYIGAQLITSINYNVWRKRHCFILLWSPESSSALALSRCSFNACWRSKRFIVYVCVSVPFFFLPIIRNTVECLSIKYEMCTTNVLLIVINF